MENENRLCIAIQTHTKTHTHITLYQNKLFRIIQLYSNKKQWKSITERLIQNGRKKIPFKNLIKKGIRFPHYLRCNNNKNKIECNF